jgi:Esterase/lipase
MKLVQFTVGENNAIVDGYLHHVPSEPVLGHHIRPAVLICPGGAYRFTSDREAEPVALAFLNAGFAAFVLRYSCGEDIKREDPLREAALALNHIRRHAEEYLVDKNKIAVMGFSAGGHLAASLSTLFADESLAGLDCRPDISILCYPVLSTKPGITHEETARNISRGGEETLRKNRSLEERVGDDTPPTFIWHTRFDQAVSVENTLLYINALFRHGIDFEAHVFEDGVHGISMANREVNTPCENTKIWFPLLMAWLTKKFDFEV